MKGKIPIWLQKNELSEYLNNLFILATPDIFFKALKTTKFVLKQRQKT